MNTRARPGVLLMTYGSPSSLSDVPGYLARVRGGREPSEELIRTFVRRYEVIGGSPLIRLTHEQAVALEACLGDPWLVEVGMRFSAPTIEQGLLTLARRGVDQVAAIVMSPQYSPLLMGGYRRAIAEAAISLRDAFPEVAVAGAWHEEPAFLDALATRIHEAIAAAAADDQDGLTVLLTAHSLPQRVAEQEPAYIEQLIGTAAAVAGRANLDVKRWRFCWQSAGHEPGDWMRPDLADVLGQLSKEGCRAVVVAPVQFLADHLEILYDLDVAARQQAEAAGLRFMRSASLNAMPQFIEALAAVAQRTLRELEGGRIDKETVGISLGFPRS